MFDLIFVVGLLLSFAVFYGFADALQPTLGTAAMSFDFILGGATFIGLLAYLLFALVRCERF